MREFRGMEMVDFLKVIVRKLGLEVDGDDVVVDSSVERFKAVGIFQGMIRHFEGRPIITYYDTSP